MSDDHRALPASDRWQRPVTIFLKMFEVILVPYLVYYLGGQLLARQQLISTQTQVLADLIKSDRGARSPDEEIAVLGILGAPAQPLLMRRMVETDCPETAASPDCVERPEASPRSSARFYGASYALANTCSVLVGGGCDATQLLQSVVLDHPDKGYRLAAVRALSLVGQSAAVAFLQRLIANPWIEEDVRTRALAVLPAFGSRVHTAIAIDGTMVRAGRALADVHIHGLTIRGSTLFAADFSGSFFQGCNVSDSVFHIERFERANWSSGYGHGVGGARSPGATPDYEVTIVSNVVFNLRRPLAAVDFVDARISGCSFRAADGPVDSTAAAGSVNFGLADIRSTTFRQIALENTNFSAASLTDVAFDGVALRQAWFGPLSDAQHGLRPAHLRRVQFVGCELANVDLSRAVLDDVRILGTTSLTGLVLAGARGRLTVEGVEFEEVSRLAREQAPALEVVYLP